MNTTRLFALALLLGLPGISQRAEAQASNDFHVTLNTQDLAGHAGDPFSVYYNLTNGSGADNGATVTLDHFNFGTGGSWVGPASITLTEQTNIFDNSFFQTFTAGDMLSFDVHLFSNSDDSPPDVFSFACEQGETITPEKVATRTMKVCDHMRRSGSPPLVSCRVGHHNDRWKAVRPFMTRRGRGVAPTHARRTQSGGGAPVENKG